MTDNGFSFFDIVDIATDFVPGLAGVKNLVDKGKVITDTLGITQEQAVKDYKKNPEAFMKQLENNKVAMQEATKLYEIEVDDRKNARALAEKMGLTDFHYTYLYMSFFLSLLCIGLVAWFGFNDKDVPVLLVSFATLFGGSFVAVGAFLFGSSSGSKLKNPQPQP